MPFALSATTRTRVGKRVQDVRDAGSVPAVMYGRGIQPQSLQIGASEFQKVYRSAGSSSLIDVTVDGATPVKVLIQDVQVHPLTLKPHHVDLRQIRMDEELTVNVPVVFQGEAPAVKELAGTLVRAVDELTVRCLPIDLPHEIVVDLSSLKTFDDMISVASLHLSKGVRVEQDPDTVLATVAAPLTEEQLKKMEEEGSADVTAVKTEAEEKRAQEDAKKAEEAAADAAAK